MKTLLLSLAATAAVFALADAAQAYPGFVNTNVVLRSGPDYDYPPVANLSANSGVNITGCIQGWQWCEVIAGPYRGWAEGETIYASSNNVPYSVVDYGPQFGLPFISFSFNDYWHRYYRNQPFYAQRARWVNHPAPVVVHRDVVVNRVDEHHPWPSERTHHVERANLHPSARPQAVVAAHEAPHAVAHEAPHEAPHDNGHDEHDFHDQHGH